jgi:hypothetical protein
VRSVGENTLDFSYFSSDDYLAEYYSAVSSENNELLRFFAKASKLVSEGSTLLEYGGGPTIYQLVSFATRVKSIYFTDHLNSNLLTVQAWLKTKQHSHDWTPFIAAALQHEGIESPSAVQISERENYLKAQLHGFGHVDAFNRHLDEIPLEHYDVVSANFVVESITVDVAGWKQGLDSLLSYVKPGGLLSLTSIRGAKYWKINDKKFPAFNVNASSITQELRARGFAIEIIHEIDAQITEQSHPGYEGYDGMIFIVARHKQG